MLDLTLYKCSTVLTHYNQLSTYVQFHQTLPKIIQIKYHPLNSLISFISVTNVTMLYRHIFMLYKFIDFVYIKIYILVQFLDTVTPSPMGSIVTITTQHVKYSMCQPFRKIICRTINNLAIMYLHKFWLV